MTPSPIQSTLLDMQTLATQSRNETPERGINTVVGGGGFAEELRDSFARINAIQQQAAGKVESFEAGSSDFSLNEVMVDVQKAGLAFQMGIQVRNRLLSAYREIMNMQV